MVLVVLDSDVKGIVAALADQGDVQRRAVRDLSAGRRVLLVHAEVAPCWHPASNAAARPAAAAPPRRRTNYQPPESHTDRETRGRQVNGSIAPRLKVIRACDRSDPLSASSPQCRYT